MIEEGSAIPKQPGDLEHYMQAVSRYRLALTQVSVIAMDVKRGERAAREACDEIHAVANAALASRAADQSRETPDA